MSSNEFAAVTPLDQQQRRQEYLTHNLARIIRELRQFCRQPRGLAEKAALRARSFEVVEWPLKLEIVEGPLKVGATALFAQSPYIEGAPTLLLYNHFANSGKGGRVVKQGDVLTGLGTVAAGSFAARLLALDSWLAEGGQLPLNVKWLIEGTERGWSAGLPELLAQHAPALRADGCLWGSGSYSSDGRAMVSLGSKGLLMVELCCQTLNQAADSALSGVLPSAAWRIIWALNAIKGEGEELKIRGYGDESDSDLDMSGEDIALLMGSVPNHKARLSQRLQDYGQQSYLMELRDPQVLLSEFLAPTANITGFDAGFTGSGSQTVLPAIARARLDFRLVPNHDPAKVFELLRELLVEKDLSDIELKMIEPAFKPTRTGADDPFVQAVVQAVTDTAEISPLVIPLSADSEPMVYLKEALNDLPVVGLGLNHSPSKPGNKEENIRLADLAQQASAISLLLGRLAAQPTLAPIEAFSLD